MRTAVMCFGRFQPVTRSHVAMFRAAESYSGDRYVFLSETVEPKNNPLTVIERVDSLVELDMIREIYWNIKPAKDPFYALRYLSEEYREIIFLCGKDRLKKFQDFYKYVNHADPEKRISDVKLVEFGDRDPDAQGLPGLSASKARLAAINGDLLTFGEIAPSEFTFDEVVELYNTVRRGLGITNGQEAT